MLKYKNLAIYIALFLFVELFVYLVLDYQTTLKIENKIALYETRVNDNYDILYQLSKDYVDANFDDILYTQNVASILANANNALDNENALNEIRNTLHKKLINKYNSMKKIGIVQFQFVLNNGVSFLRFHDPKRYGDELLPFRESLEYVHKYKMPVHTFESGRIFSGYRFAYPIFTNEDVFVGSVEISYKVEHIINHFEKNFFKTVFIENKESVVSKLFDDFSKDYVEFPIHNDFVIKKTIFSGTTNYELIKDLAAHTDKAEIVNKINSKQSFSIYYKNDNNNYEIVHFKAVFHTLTNKFLGFVVLASPINDIQDYINIFYIGFFILSLFVFIIFLYIYTLKETKKELSTILSHEKKLLEKIDQYVIYGKSDLSGNIIDVSEAFCEVCGYTKTELLGKKFKMLRHPDMPKETFKDLWSTITSGNVWQREIKNLAKDGSFYWVKINIQPDYDEDGKIESYTAISQNISYRKRIEAIYRDIRFQVEQYNAIFDNANSGIGTIDLNGNFLKTNNKFSELLNITAEELLNINFAEKLEYESRNAFKMALNQVKISSKNIQKLPLEYSKTKKYKSYLEVSLNLLPDKNSIVIVANPLDDKIKLQKTLEFNKTLLYAIPLPVFIQDKDLMLVECNKAFLEFFNLTKNAVIGKKLQDIIGKNLTELIPQELSNLYKNQDEYKIEKNLAMYQTKIKNWLGVEKTVEIYKTTYNYKDNFNGIIGVMVDISVKEEQTNKLQQTIVNKTLENIKQTQEFEEERLKSIKFQAIGQLAAGITHEINTPLTFAKGNLEMMLYDIKDLPNNTMKDNLLEISDSIMTGLNRIANIVESMREVSQQSSEVKEDINLYSTLLVALTMAHNRAKIITKIYINSDEFEIGMDKNSFVFMSNIQKQRIEQVWIIIINNALDELVKIEPFEKRYLDIKIETKNGYNIIYFRDNAGGIPENIKDNIFHPFVSNKTSSGMGIGLNIAQKIIKDNNGEILAYNDEFGAVFEVRLPCI